MTFRRGRRALGANGVPFFVIDRPLPVPAARSRPRCWPTSSRGCAPRADPSPRDGRGLAPSVTSGSADAEATAVVGPVRIDRDGEDGRPSTSRCWRREVGWSTKPTTLVWPTVSEPTGQSARNGRTAQPSPGMAAMPPVGTTTMAPAASSSPLFVTRAREPAGAHRGDGDAGDRDVRDRDLGEVDGGRRLVVRGVRIEVDAETIAVSALRPTWVGCVVIATLRTRSEYGTWPSRSGRCSRRRRSRGPRRSAGRRGRGAQDDRAGVVVAAVRGGERVRQLAVGVEAGHAARDLHVGDADLGDGALDPCAVVRGSTSRLEVATSASRRACRSGGRGRRPRSRRDRRMRGRRVADEPAGGVRAAGGGEQLLARVEADREHRAAAVALPSSRLEPVERLAGRRRAGAAADGQVGRAEGRRDGRRRGAGEERGTEGGERERARAGGGSMTVSSRSNPPGGGRRGARDTRSAHHQAGARYAIGGAVEQQADRRGHLRGGRDAADRAVAGRQLGDGRRDPAGVGDRRCTMLTVMPSRPSSAAAVSA